MSPSDPLDRVRVFYRAVNDSDVEAARRARSPATRTGGRSPFPQIWLKGDRALFHRVTCLENLWKRALSPSSVSLVDEAGSVRYHFVLVDYLCRPRGGTLQAGGDIDHVAAKAHDVIARALRLVD